ncbi:MAG: single-stranded-DNA-specific exonuclease RecJ [Planctomycetes bacterium]|nr:single-stranded-DNA-specific exonuclease RecJ [Planctomycetota bacterium]
MDKKWLITPTSPLCAELAAGWRLPKLVAQLLVNRGVDRATLGERFLTPRLKDLHPPAQLPGSQKAAEIIIDAIRKKRKIVLYGDYDVDGTTGLAILWHTIRCAGREAGFYVPHRVDEGYGLNRKAVERLADDGADLIVTIDCGITAVEEAEFLRKRGVGLIVTDHHTPQKTLPVADAIVHPQVGGCYDNPHLCGAGVAFKLAWSIGQALAGGERVDASFRSLLVDLLPLAALGTIADVVPLVGENRIIARHGLQSLPSCELPGIQALIESAGLLNEEIDGYDVGFKLAPRINAAGRMGHARLAVELFTRANADRAREITLYLETHNRSRQSTERKIYKQARELVEQRGLASDSRRILVVAAEGWHAGVIGIVASRLVAHYHRPAVVIALADGRGQGSARSIDSFDLAKAFADCGEHLVSHGGHAMAAGLQIEADRIPAFAESLVEVANNRLTAADLIPKLRLDAEVDLEELTMPTAEAISALGPFGAGNPKPRLATAWVDVVSEPRCVGKQQDHLQATFAQNGVQIKAIGFGLGYLLEDLKQHRRCRVAFEPIINEFRGRRSVEMQMLDVKFSG